MWVSLLLLQSFFVRRIDYFGSICQSNHSLTSEIKFRVFKVHKMTQKVLKFSHNSMFLSRESNSFPSQLCHFVCNGSNYVILTTIATLWQWLQLKELIYLLKYHIDYYSFDVIIRNCLYVWQLSSLSLFPSSFC